MRLPDIAIKMPDTRLLIIVTRNSAS